MKEWQLKEAKKQLTKIISNAARGEEQVLIEIVKKFLWLYLMKNTCSSLKGTKTLLDVFASAPKIELNIERDKTPIKPFELE